MEKKVLIRLPNGTIRPFGERAAKIAVQLLGGYEIDLTDQSPKAGKVPPQITKPIPLKPVEVKPTEVKAKEVKPAEVKPPPPIKKADPVVKAEEKKKPGRKPAKK